MREKAFSLSLSVLATLACALLCASTTHADQASAAAPAPAVGNANPAPAPAIAPAPEPRLPASGLTVVSTLPCQPCGPCGCRHFANNEAYRFDPTGNNPNIPRGLVGSGYYGAYSPDSYHHSACGADFGAAYGYNAAAYAPAASAPRNSYELAGQNGRTQTTYYRPNAAPATAAAQPATPTGRQYGWR